VTRRLCAVPISGTLMRRGALYRQPGLAKRGDHDPVGCGWRRQSCWGSSPIWVERQRAAPPHDKRGRITFLATDVDNIQRAKTRRWTASRNHRGKARKANESSSPPRWAACAPGRWTGLCSSGVGAPPAAACSTLLASAPALGLSAIVRKLPIRGNHCCWIYAAARPWALPAAPAGAGAEFLPEPGRLLA